MSKELEFPNPCPMCSARANDGDLYGHSLWTGPLYRREQGSDKSFRVFRCTSCDGHIAWRDDDQLIQRSEWQINVKPDTLCLP